MLTDENRLLKVQVHASGSQAPVPHQQMQGSMPYMPPPNQYPPPAYHNYPPLPPPPMYYHQYHAYPPPPLPPTSSGVVEALAVAVLNMSNTQYRPQYHRHNRHTNFRGRYNHSHNHNQLQHTWSHSTTLQRDTVNLVPTSSTIPLPTLVAMGDRTGCLGGSGVSVISTRTACLSHAQPQVSWTPITVFRYCSSWCGHARAETR